MAKHKQRKARAARAKQHPTSALTATATLPVALAQSAAPLPPAAGVVRPRRYGQRFGAILGLYAGLGFAALVMTLPPRLGSTDRLMPAGFAGGGARLAALPGPTPTVAPPPALSDDPRAALLAATTALRARHAWRVRQVASTDGSSFVQTIAFVAPDRYRVFQPGIAEVVAVGDAGWLRHDEAWRASPNAPQVARTAADAIMRLGQAQAALAPEVVVERLADDWLAGDRVQVYAFTSPAVITGQAPTAVTWWVRATDGLPLRLRQTTRSVTHESSTELTFDYAPLTIAGPAPEHVLPAATVDPAVATDSAEWAPDNPLPAAAPPTPFPAPSTNSGQTQGG